MPTTHPPLPVLLELPVVPFPELVPPVVPAPDPEAEVAPVLEADVPEMPADPTLAPVDVPLEPVGAGEEQASPAVHRPTRRNRRMHSSLRSV